MAYSSKEIVDYLLANPEMDDAQIAKAMETYKISPAQMAAAVGMQEGEIAARVAATLPPNQAVLLGDTYVQAVNQVIGSGQDQQIGALENVITYKANDNQAGGDINYFSPTGEFQQTTKQQEVAGSFLGGLAEAFNDPVVQAAFLGLGGGGALGNALGLTGSTAQAVGTGLFKGGAAAAGGADLEDALKLGLLSGGLVYGGSELAKTLNTAGGAVLGDASDIAMQMADAGKTLTEIETTLTNSGFSADVVAESLKDAANTLAPKAINIPSTVSGLTDAVNVVGQSATPTLSNVINTLAAAPVAVSTPVSDGGTVKVTGTTEPKMTTQQAVDLVNSQIAANVSAPTNLANLQVTAPKTQQDLINTLAATLPVGINTPINTTATPEIATQTITAQTPPKIGDALAAITTIPSTLNPTAVTATTTPTTPTKETDPLRVAQLALAAAGLLGAGSALSSSGTPTGFDIVPIPETFLTPKAPTVAPFTPLPPINFGDRNLLIGTQWEKFLDPNYGKVPEPVQYSQPSNMSYNDLMSILGSKQGMPSASSLSINDIISGIQNQYGQTPTRTMG